MEKQDVPDFITDYCFVITIKILKCTNVTMPNEFKIEKRLFKTALRLQNFCIFNIDYRSFEKNIRTLFKNKTNYKHLRPFKTDFAGAKTVKTK